MAKKPNIPCAKCGKLLWPDSRRSGPISEWLCIRCGAGSRRHQPLLWRLGTHLNTTTLVLEECRRCGALPTIAAAFPGGTAPRAITWQHEPGCRSGASSKAVADATI